MATSTNASNSVTVDAAIVPLLYYFATASVITRQWTGSNVHNHWYTFGEPATREMTYEFVKSLFVRNFPELDVYDQFLIVWLEVSEEHWRQIGDIIENPGTHCVGLPMYKGMQTTSAATSAL